MNFSKFASVGLLALGLAAVMAPRPSFAAMDMKALDPDADGTVSMDEAKAAATAKFTALDPDKDGTIDMKEAKGTITKPGFMKADPDKDGTIDQAEYMAAVEAGFTAADPDKDGTLDAKELKTPAGKTLMKWLQ